MCQLTVILIARQSILGEGGGGAVVAPVSLSLKKSKLFFLPSPVSNQSLLTESVASSQVESTVVDKTVPETEDLQG